MKSRNSFKTLNELYHIHDSKQFWKLVRRRRLNGNDPSSDINLQTLVDHYTKKFSPPRNINDTIRSSQQCVDDKINNLTLHDQQITQTMVKRYICKLKLNCSPANDGITAEHLLYGIDSNIPHQVANMLSLCIKYSVVPDIFTNGMLVPIPKKPGCDTSNPKNWRPIIISTTLSKILELYILEESSNHNFSDSQFGFIAGRGTEIATALVNDVKLYCNSKNSAVYSCSLDAEGAFDAIPHSVLFAKASTALPDHCWHVMVKWYNRLSVQIKWCNQLSSKVKICVGTRQGGLSSPFLFNMFYQDLVNKLSNCAGGIQINNESYNVFCYADDLILTSLSVTGLQTLINTASRYIVSHGLNFNPTKTICTTFGRCTLANSPHWQLNGSILRDEPNVNYLGTVLSNNPKAHIDARLQAARRAFYGLQSSGMCESGVSPVVSAHMYKVAIQPILTYGCSTLNVSPCIIDQLDKYQAKLIKSSLGLPKCCRNTPLLKALSIKKIERILQVQQLTLMKNAMISNSKARSFYLHMMRKSHSVKNGNLFLRCNDICKSHGLSLSRYIFDEHYVKRCKTLLYSETCDGVADTICTLLTNYNYNSKMVIKQLLTPYQLTQ